MYEEDTIGPQSREVKQDIYKPHFTRLSISYDPSFQFPQTEVAKRPPVLPGQSTVQMYLESFLTPTIEGQTVAQLSARLESDPNNGELLLHLALVGMCLSDFVSAVLIDSRSQS